MSKEEILNKIVENKSEVKKLGVKKLGLFGSYAKGQEKQGSDVDILVEFKKKTFDNYIDLKFLLEKLLGTKVDLVIQEAIKPRLKALIMKEVVYAKGL
ncbi:MAG: nucleotidyltransferase family protein [Candidatus Margulisiibacteriota bacterium]